MTCGSMCNLPNCLRRCVLPPHEYGDGIHCCENGHHFDW
jgi:hypothetical protein